jgi:hypothetical protein
VEDIHVEHRCQSLKLILFELFNKELNNLIRQIMLIYLPSFYISVSFRVLNSY